MSAHRDVPSILIVDPINHTGMAYYDAGLAGGLAAAGSTVVVAGSDEALVGADTTAWRLIPVYRQTAGKRPRWRRAIAYTVATARLARLLWRRRPDIVIWNYFGMPAIDVLAIRWARRVGSTVVFVAHETEPWTTSSLQRRTFHWTVARGADRVIVHGETNAGRLLESWPVPAERVIVSEHGDYRAWVDPAADGTVARQRLGLPVDGPMALLFGTLRMSKGVHSLLDAWPAVRAVLPTAELVIAGRPYSGTEMAAFADLPDGVTLRAGAVSPATANDYYAACDVVAIPYDKVSTSGVMRFAYSAARPVIATDVGELHDHVEHGRTGWLVAPGDRNALVAALVDCLADRERASSMGKLAFRHADARFDWGLIGSTLLRQLVGMAPSRRP